jgi:hypothetical protein
MLAGRRLCRATDGTPDTRSTSPPGAVNRMPVFDFHEWELIAWENAIGLLEKPR